MRHSPNTPGSDHPAGQRRLRGLLLALGIMASGVLSAQTSPITVIMERPRCEPCVPEAASLEAAREKARTAHVPARPLPAVAGDRLRARFAAADVRKGGRLTRTEAAAGGFGFIAQNFDAIDVQGKGEVSFDDLAAFLKARGARVE